MNQEILFLNKLAEAYQSYNSSVIEEFLDEDMHYASMWVFQELTSKKEYLDYLSKKLQVMKEHNKRMDFEIVNGGMHNHALLVKGQLSPEGSPLGFVADFNEKGKVIMLNITMQSFF